MNTRVILAAGHGGGDSGAVSRGTTEAAQAIDIVNRTAEYLRRDGRVEVVVVPHELGLVQTIGWINARYKNLEDGLALEIHKNSGGGTGVETWYYADDQESKRKADALQFDLARIAEMPNRGSKDERTNRWGQLGFVHDTNPWALLVECGFIDRDHFDNDKYAHGLARGILAAGWGVVLKEDVVPTTPPPVVVPPKVTWNWKVLSVPEGKQLVAASKKETAWNYYKSAKGAARIVDVTGADVTAAFVAEFRPTPPQSPDAEPSDQAHEDEQDQKIGALQASFQSLASLVDRILSAIGLKK